MNLVASTVTPSLAISDLAKSYRGVAALDGVSFSVPKGALTVVLGAAGAGKTTLLRCIAGLERADAGSIHIAGRDTSGLEPKDRDVAMIFDNLALYPDKTGFDNIANPLRIRGTSKIETEIAVKDVAGRLKISHILNRKPKTMSGGERQRVALGRALVRTPELFLLDEPLSSLDAQLRIELRTELRRLQRDLGYTFLLATPDFAEAMAIADTVVMVCAGKIVQIADPQTLYDHPADREVARFVGAPEINIVSAEVGPDMGVTFAGQRIELPPKLRPLTAPKSRAVEIGIRPEDMRIVPAGQGAFNAVVTDIEPLGSNGAVTVEVAGIELRLVAPTDDLSSIVAGLEVGISVQADRFHAFDPATGLRLA